MAKSNELSSIVRAAWASGVQVISLPRELCDVVDRKMERVGDLAARISELWTVAPRSTYMMAAGVNAVDIGGADEKRVLDFFEAFARDDMPDTAPSVHLRRALEREGRDRSADSLMDDYRYAVCAIVYYLAGYEVTVLGRSNYDFDGARIEAKAASTRILIDHATVRERARG